MSFLLRMETEAVLNCAFQIRAESERLRQQAQWLVFSARSMEWYGPSRDSFQFEVEQLAIALTRLADDGETLAIRVQAEIEQWQSVDSLYSRNFRKI